MSLTAAVRRQFTAAPAKNTLQHLALTAGEAIPTYHTERSGGPDHAPHFTSRVTVRDRHGEGTGNSRKSAETAAPQTS